MKRRGADEVGAALAEDVGPGDVTTDVLFPQELKARGRIVAKSRGILAGMAAAKETFARLDPKARWRAAKKDGDDVRPGMTVATVDTTARALLAGERTALNFLQRLSGVATLSREFSKRARGATILDTRKTTPGLRRLEKAAVKAGGASNHRIGLFDAAMIKDNHFLLMGNRDLGAAVRELQRRGRHVTVEAKSMEELRRATGAGADRVLLDNFPVSRLRRMIRMARRLRPGIEVEISGGVNLDTVAAIARLRPDFISVGALTHSAPALDFSLDAEPR